MTRGINNLLIGEIAVLEFGHDRVEYRWKANSFRLQARNIRLQWQACIFRRLTLSYLELILELL